MKHLKTIKLEGPKFDGRMYNWTAKAKESLYFETDTYHVLFTSHTLKVANSTYDHYQWKNFKDKDYNQMSGLQRMFWEKYAEFFMKLERLYNK